MNSYELYILAIACYLHDIGMALSPMGKRKIKNSLDFEVFKRDQKIAHPDKDEEDILKDYIRAIHQRRSEDYILKNWEGERGLMIRSYAFAKAAARVAMGHRQEDLLDFQLFDPKCYVVSGKDPVCLPFLACCLMLADELDMTRERTPELLCEFVDPKKPVNKKEWDRCRSTLAVGIDGTKIKIQAECENPKIHKAILESAKKVQNTIDLSHKVILNLPQELKDKYCIAIDGVATPKIEAKGYLYREFRFDVDENFVTRMFMGNKLYPSKWDFMRELLQNSIDTCRLKCKIKANYVPKISLRLSEDKSKLWIEDNGMGMNEFIIENFLMKIGRSYYKSYEYEKQYGNLGLSPISEFGIGLLSCFMAADSLTVETLMDGNSPVRLEVEGLPEDFVIRPGSRNEPGTTIELCLKKEIREEINDELLEALTKHYARHVEFPIELLKQDGNKSYIKDKGFGFNVEDLLQPFDKPKAKQYEIVSSQIKPTKSNPIRGKIGIVLRRGQNGRLMPVKNFYPDFQNILEIFGIELSQKGILVYPKNKYSSQSISFLGTGWIGNINVENVNLLDLNLSRDRCFATAGSATLERVIVDHEVKILKWLFAKEWSQFDKKKLAELTADLIVNYDFTDYFPRPTHITQKLSSFISENLIFTCLINSSVNWRSINEFVKEADKWILLRRRINIKESELKKAIKLIEEDYQKSKYILGYYTYETSEISKISETDFDISEYDFLHQFFIARYDRNVIVSDSNQESYYEFINSAKTKQEKKVPFLAWNQFFCTFTNQPQLLITRVHRNLPLNKRHPFIEILTTNADKIEKSNINVFFRQFFEDLSEFAQYLTFRAQPKRTQENLNELINKQKILLNWLLENQLISKREANDLLLKKGDFPSWLFK